MQLNATTIIIIAAACMFFGYFFGLFEGRGQGYRKRKKEEEQAKMAEEQKPEDPVPPPAPMVADDPGLLRLKEENGKIQLEMDGERIGVDTLTADKRKRLIELLTRFRPWVDGRQIPANPVQASPSINTPFPQSQPAPAAGTQSVVPPLSSVGPPVAKKAPAQVASPTLPRKEEPASPKTMVGQIDAILQERILDTPLASRGIKLEESPEGSVTVVVGINRYSGVGEVPDAEVQAAIRAAIAEWERKFTPG